MNRPSDHSQDDEPTELNINSVGHAINVEKDRLTVRYTGDGRHDHDVGACQANKAVPRRRLVYYYEVHIVDQGAKGRIGVGFAGRDFKLTRQPGWDANSFGYHGDDGKKFGQSGMGVEYGPTFGTGDVVGAGIHLGRQEVFFTKNGVKLKTAFHQVKGELYPTVGLHSKNECVKLNFGSKPFRFDLDAYIAEERAAQQAAINKMQVPSQAALSLVYDYLRHHGFANTLHALTKAAGPAHTDLTKAFPKAPPVRTEPSTSQPMDTDDDHNTASLQNGQQSHQQHEQGQHQDTSSKEEGVDDDTSWLQLRQHVRQSVISGDIDEAISAVKRQYPQVLQEGSGHERLRHQLFCQKFIELVRHGHVTEALSWAQQQLAPIRHRLPECEEQLREVMALLAYGEPQSSPLNYLLSDSHKACVADNLNLALLQAAAGLPGDAPPPQAALSRLLSQVVIVHQKLFELNHNQGEPFDLQAVLSSSAASTAQPMQK